MHATTVTHHLCVDIQDWEVLAEESLDATQEPGEETGPDVHLQAGGASISWRGDGKYFATNCSSEGKSVCNPTMNMQAILQHAQLQIKLHLIIS